MLIVFFMSIVSVGSSAIVDEYPYSEGLNGSSEKEDEDDWAVNAVLDVAFYLRLHKFNDFDRRYYLKIEENSSYFYAQFPVPPLMTFHWEVYEKCLQDFQTCLKYLQSIVAETQFQRTESTEHVMHNMNWTWTGNGSIIHMVNDECLRLKTLDWSKPEPFSGPLDRFRWRVTASYFMCWYTMQNTSLLLRFNEPCDDIGECYQVHKIHDFRADNSVSYQCAMYSFCPDPCCPIQNATHPSMCQDVNPCRYNMVTNSSCEFHRNQNTWLPSIVYNEWNVSCNCNKGYQWDSRYGTCIDINECSENFEICNTTSETCINLPGRYKCICRWGFMWSPDQRVCVPDIAVKRAEIRFGLRNHPDYTETSASIASTNYWTWTNVKNAWHKYAPSWLFKTS